MSNLEKLANEIITILRNVADKLVALDKKHREASDVSHK